MLKAEKDCLTFISMKRWKNKKWEKLKGFGYLKLDGKITIITNEYSAI